MNLCNVGHYWCASLVLLQEARTTPPTLVFWIPTWPIRWSRDDERAKGASALRHGFQEECRRGWLGKRERRGVYEGYEVEMGEISMECGHG